MWSFYFQPNIWGEPDEPAYYPFFSRSEMLKNGSQLIVILAADDFSDLPPSAWHDFMEREWERNKNESLAESTD